MKRRELIQKLAQQGVVFDRNGGEHDIYWNPITNRPISIPRHREIGEILAKEILKQAGVTK